MKFSGWGVCLFFVSSLLFFGCNGDQTNSSNELITINLESMVSNERAIGLADIAMEVSYIPLETSTIALK